MTKDAVCQFRVEAEDKALFEAKAKELDMSLADWIVEKCHAEDSDDTYKPTAEQKRIVKAGADHLGMTEAQYIMLRVAGVIPATHKKQAANPMSMENYLKPYSRKLEDTSELKAQKKGAA